MMRHRALALLVLLLALLLPDAAHASLKWCSRNSSNAFNHVVCFWCELWEWVDLCDRTGGSQPPDTSGSCPLSGGGSADAACCGSNPPASCPNPGPPGSTEVASAQGQAVSAATALVNTLQNIDNLEDSAPAGIAPGGTNKNAATLGVVTENVLSPSGKITSGSLNVIGGLGDSSEGSGSGAATGGGGNFKLALTPTKSEELRDPRAGLLDSAGAYVSGAAAAAGKAASKLADGLFKGKGWAGGADSQASLRATQQSFAGPEGASGGATGPVMASFDPEEYFALTSVGDNLFELVHKRYRAKTPALTRVTVP